MAIFSSLIWVAMDSPERLAKLRKERGMTQKSLADMVEVHITQIQRYENGSTQPALDIIRKLAITMISARPATKHEIKQYQGG